MPSPESTKPLHKDAKAAAHGTELIADFVSRLPYKPGVYRMFDEQGEKSEKAGYRLYLL